MSIHLPSPQASTTISSNRSFRNSTPDLPKEIISHDVAPENQEARDSLEIQKQVKPKTNAFQRLLKSLCSCSKPQEPIEPMALKDPQELVLLIIKGKKRQAVSAVKKGNLNPERVSIGGFSPLDAAITNNSKKVTQALINAGVDLNKPSIWGKTPIQVASQNGYIEILNMLLASGRVNVDAVDNFGCTAMHTAIQNNKNTILESLIQAKANPNLHDHFGRTPLHTAAEFGRNQSAALLLNANIEVNPLDNFGNTPLDAICRLSFTPERIEILKLLLQHGAEPGKKACWTSLIANPTLEALEKLHKNLSNTEEPDQELIQLLNDRLPRWKAESIDNKGQDKLILPNSIS